MGQSTGFATYLADNADDDVLPVESLRIREIMTLVVERLSLN